MPKAERGSVKDIANRMKAKGLQKLKFYCQMCNKQCRDANGFKCHIQSDYHLRQMKIFGDNASGYLKQFSEEFEQSFLTNLKMRHGTKKVNANNVYQEVIADKEHIHMNATHWTTLSEFVQYLGRTKKCIVEENHSDGTGGWTVSYIETNVGMLARREAQQRREAADKRAEEVLLERMKRQRIEASKAIERMNGGSSSRAEATSILGGNNNHTIKMGIASNTKSKKSTPSAKKSSAFGDDDEDSENDTMYEKPKTKASHTNVERIVHETRNHVGAASLDPSATKKRRHNNDDVAAAAGDAAGDATEAERKNKRSKSTKSSTKEGHFSKDSLRKKKQQGWLYRDIIVRVISEKLEGGKYFRKKAVVDRVLGDGFVAEVEILGGGDVLRLDQSDLETVVPKNFKKSRVRILRGKFRGETARVDYLDKSRYHADLVVKDKAASRKDERRLHLRDVPYEDFSSIMD